MSVQISFRRNKRARAVYGRASFITLFEEMFPDDRVTNLKKLQIVLQKLKPDEFKIIELRYFEDMPFKTVAGKFSTLTEKQCQSAHVSHIEKWRRFHETVMIHNIKILKIMKAKPTLTDEETGSHMDFNKLLETHKATTGANTVPKWWRSQGDNFGQSFSQPPYFICRTMKEVVSESQNGAGSTCC